jgi:hypothetical protein
MRVVAGVDFSNEASAIVQTVLYLYAPQELVLVHAVDLGLLDSYALVPITEQQVHDELQHAKRVAREAACQSLDGLSAGCGGCAIGQASV